MTPFSRIGVIGAGAVGVTLALAFQRSGRHVCLAHAREANRPAWPHHNLPVMSSAQTVVDNCDLVLLTVPDDAIRGVCEGLQWTEGRVVVHCSGATELSALESAARGGASVGGFHPLQMFAKPEVALAGLPGCLVAIEAGPEVSAQLHDLAIAIQMRPWNLPAGVRARYHASANYVGPFVLAVLKEATAIWESFGATEDEALAALRPLLRGTLAAAEARGLAGGMGGCVARGDVGTVGAHLHALDALSPEVGRLYRALSLRTIPLAQARGTLSDEGARRIRERLGG
jgi:predicted short-subunit dehydrogenase-like oxidoreductase (DUF2520 family)